MPSGKGKSRENKKGVRRIINFGGTKRTLAPRSVRRKGKKRFIEECSQEELIHAGV